MDNIKEFKFSNNFYAADGDTNGKYTGEFVFDLTTNQVLSASTTVGGTQFSTADIASVSGPDSNGQYTVSFAKNYSVGDPRSGYILHSDKSNFQFTGSSPNSFDEVSVTQGSAQQRAHPIYTYTTRDTLNSAADQRQVRLVDPPAVSVSINLAGYNDTGIKDDGLTSDPTVTLSGTDRNASNVEVYQGTTDLGSATRASDGTWSLTTTLANGQYTNFSAVATSSYTSQTADASTSTALTIDTAPPSVTIDPTTAGFRSGRAPVLTGTASSSNGVAGVELYDGDTDLGAATVNADGTWTYTDNLGSGDYANLTAVATAASGTTASATAPYELVTGVKGQPYAALEYDYAADGSYGYTAYGKTGTPLVTATNNGDGTHTIQANANGQLLYSAGNDTMTGGGTGETFVFTPHFGQAEITDFRAAGVGHDVVDLSGTHLHTLAQVLNSTTVNQGTATIHVNGQDAITLDGVTRADIRTHRSDFQFA